MAETIAMTPDGGTLWTKQKSRVGILYTPDVSEQEALDIVTQRIELIRRLPLLGQGGRKNGAAMVYRHGRYAVRVACVSHGDASHNSSPWLAANLSLSRALQVFPYSSERFPDGISTPIYQAGFLSGDAFVCAMTDESVDREHPTDRGDNKEVNNHCMEALRLLYGNSHGIFCDYQATNTLVGETNAVKLDAYPYMGFNHV